MVAPEDEWQRSAPGGVRHEPGQPVAEIQDLIQVAGVLVAHRRGLRDRRDDVAGVGDPNAELLPELLLETRIADRGRSHVDTAPTGTEIERCSDDGDLAQGLLDAHGAEANAESSAPVPSAHPELVE